MVAARLSVFGVLPCPVLLMASLYMRMLPDCIVYYIRVLFVPVSVSRFCGSVVYESFPNK